MASAPKTSATAEDHTFVPEDRGSAWNVLSIPSRYLLQRRSGGFGQAGTRRGTTQPTRRRPGRCFSDRQSPSSYRPQISVQVLRVSRALCLI